ncbi:unnamed protein product [Arabidopsis thaliana]|uniref:(thale cress) hypothetical protein n=1 Tax=Arabidopsis thaliana TaxID=3702 RepID=A0A7G2ESU1_ARATH|nr:unnamed protein product [Arabidopsis thaliana]
MWNNVADIYNDVNIHSSINAYQDLAVSLDELKTTSSIVVLTFWHQCIEYWDLIYLYSKLVAAAWFFYFKVSFFEPE